MAGRNNDVIKIASILSVPLNVISIVVNGDQHFLCSLFVNFSQNTPNLILGGK